MGKIITVEGYKAFRGVLVVYIGKNKTREIFGDWLYKPETDCWYGNGESIPASICKIASVE